MKKNLLVLLLIVALAMVGFAGCGGNDAPAPAPAPEAGDAGNDAPAATEDKTYVLKYSFGQPLESTDGKGYQYWAEVLKEESNGTLQVELYPASSLLTWLTQPPLTSAPLSRN